MNYTPPEPAYIWHDNPADEYDNEMFDFKQVGAVDVSDIYTTGKCEHCTRLFTESQLRSEVDRVRRETVEECAKVCYTIKETVWDHSSPPGQYETTASQAVECAKKIKELLK